MRENLFYILIITIRAILLQFVQSRKKHKKDSRFPKKELEEATGTDLNGKKE
jgi:hypothetical protein